MSDPLVERDASELMERIRQRTPARIFTGAAGGGYLTSTLLQLRADHAAARDAVWDDVEVERDLPGLFEVATLATNKQEYLLRPDLGRRLAPAARDALASRCLRGVDVQVFVGDGLSAAAVKTQVPALLPLVLEKARGLRWTVGVPFFVRHCRVGVLNDVGEVLDCAVAVLLIGERPGLATAESLSAYLAYRPRGGDTDAKRNLISNIHSRGVAIEEAASRILGLAARMRSLQASGVGVKEELSPLTPGSLESAPPHTTSSAD